MSSIRQYYHSLDIYKKGIWLYLILTFVLEVMRKWFMPELSSLWMISREPIVIWFVLAAMQKRWIKSKVAITFMVVACIAFLFTMTFGHGNLFVAIWGFRIWFFHIPFVFAAAHILDKRDLEWIIKFLILMFFLSLPIIFMQFNSSTGSFWNAQAGAGMDSVDTGVGTELATIRPAGFFSHCIGASYYNPIIFSILIAMFFSARYRNIITKRWLFYAFLLGMLYTLVTSVSRGLIFNCAVTLAMVMFVEQSIKPSAKIKNILIVVVIGAVTFAILQSTDFGAKLIQPITKRFTDAAEAEGGSEGIFQSRVIYPYLWFAPPNVTTLNWSLTPFGYGLGLSSNFAAQTMSGSYGFILGEWSSQQMTGEMGVLLGTVVFFLRVGFCFYLLPKCIDAIKRRDDALPLALWFFNISGYGNGNINLTMTLGLICISMILLLVALKPDPKPIIRQEEQEPKLPPHKFRPFELNRLTGIRSSGDRK